MNYIDSTGKTWTKVVCPVANAITDDTLTTVYTPAANETIVISDYKVWNRHASVSTDVDIYDGSTVIDAGPAGFDMRGWIDNRNAMLELTEGNALKIKCNTTGTSTRYSFTIALKKRTRSA